MRAFIALLVFIFGLQTCTKADDISDFQMEGISIGDSLLNFSTEKKIKSAKSNRQYPNDKFIIYEADKFLEINNYNFFAVTIKKNDKKYIITSMSGSIYFDKFQYGKNSFIKHTDNLKKQKIEFKQIFNKELYFELDTSQDFEVFIKNTPRWYKKLSL